MISRRSVLTAHLGTGVGLLALATAEPDTIMPLLALIAFLAVSALARDRGEPAAPAWVRGMVLASALLLLVFEFVTRSLADATETVSVFARFIAWLAVIKALEARTARNMSQLIVLGVMLSVAAVLVSVSLLMGVIVLAQLVIALYAIMSYQVWASELEATDRGSPADPEPPAALRKDLRATLVSMFAFAVPGAIVVFVLLPRDIGGSAIGSWNPPATGGARTSDFNDSIQLGASGFISASPEVALEVEIQIYDQNRELTPPFDSDGFLLRGAVLDRYDTRTGTWTSSEARRTSTVSTLGPGTAFDNPGNVLQRITVRNKANDHLFAVYAPRALRIHQPQQFGRRHVARMDLRTRELFEQDMDGFMTYEVVSVPSTVIPTDRPTARIDAVPPGRLALGPPPPDEGEDEDENNPGASIATEVIRLHPVPTTFRETPIEALARGVMTNAGYERRFDETYAEQDLLIARTFLAWLQREKTYSLDLEAPPQGADPIEWWLRRGSVGHCEYFASGLAAMCQAVGINARVVTGYAASERTGPTTFIVRRAHAHAWTEVEIERGRWITLDASPSAGVMQYHNPEGVFAVFRRFRDRIDSFWVRNIVSYNRDAQLGVVDPVSDFFGVDLETGRTRTNEPLQAWIRPVLSLAVGVTLIVLGARPLVLRWLRGRREASDLRGRFGDGDDAALLARQAAFYRDLRRTLDGAGLPRPPSTPPLHHAASLPVPAAEPAAGLVHLYYKLRYARASLTDDELAQAEARLDHLRVALRAHAQGGPSAAPTTDARMGTSPAR